MIKLKAKEKPSGNVLVTILQGWQHPYGTYKEAGTTLTVTSEYASELVAEGIAEIKL